jgi:hypothetical protein
MIIDDEYIISAFHLKSGVVIYNKLIFSEGTFNFYNIGKDNKQMKLYIRTKGKDEDNEECIIEKLILILSPDCIEYVEMEEVEKIKKDMLKILDIIDEDDEDNSRSIF